MDDLKSLLDSIVADSVERLVGQVTNIVPGVAFVIAQNAAKSRFSFVESDCVGGLPPVGSLVSFEWDGTVVRKGRGRARKVEVVSVPEIREMDKTKGVK